MKVTVNILAFSLLIGFMSCKKKDKSTDDSTPTTTGAPTVAPLDVNSNPQVQFQLDGKSYSFVNGVDKVQNDMSSSKSLDVGGVSKGVYGTGFHSSEHPHFDLENGTILFSGDFHPDTAAFKAFFAPGAHNYSAASYDSTGTWNGIELVYWENDSTKWSTGYGPANQTGSNFKIEQRKERIVFGDQYITIYCTFNCKLYNKKGNSKTLTNGKLVGTTENN